MASAISSCRYLENLSGKNQDAANFNRFTNVWLMTLIGLLLGVKMPVLTWTNEITPIKQGAPVMIILFGGFVYMALLFTGFMLLPGWILGFCGYKSVYISVGIPVVTGKRCCHFGVSITTKNM